MSETTIYRVTAFFRRRPDITEEEFYHHWGNIHGPLVTPWALKHGFLEYTQFQTPSELRKHLSPGPSDFKTPLEFDAAADFYIRSYKAYADAFKDPYYINVIEPDENKFVDKGQGTDGKQTVVRSMSALGVCRSIIKDGKPAVEVSKDVMDVWEKYEAESS